MAQRGNIRIHESATGRRTSVASRAAHVNRRSQTVRVERVPLTRRPLARAVIVVVLIVAFLAIAASVATCQVSNNKFVAVERWRGTVEQACTDCDLGTEWTDTLLAAMYVESGGDENVSSVEGVKHDIMQAAEGAYGSIVKEGSAKYGVAAQTCEASIYAGTLEFKKNLELWHGYFGTITPEDTGEVQLVIQGYNFGARGWYTWCTANGITSYSVETARRYSEEKMPEDAKGTPTHAEKWLEAYTRIMTDAQQ